MGHGATAVKTTEVKIMLEMVEGCQVQNSHLLSEQYEKREGALIANVHAHKIKEVLRHFITTQTERLL